MHYLEEMRRRLIHCLFVVGGLFVLFCCFANPLYDVIAKPLIALLPGNKALIATQISTTFLVPFKLAFAVSLVISFPYILYQTWLFIVPALYKHEKNTAWIILVPSVFLFYLGLIFTYFIVLPLSLNFFVSVTPQSVEMRPDISQYFDFVLQLFLVFGFAFEVPIITMLLIKFGILKRDQLKKLRPYVIVAAFILGMFLSPPDVISQTLLAIPLWLLFELGIILSRFIKINNPRWLVIILMCVCVFGNQLGLGESVLSSLFV